MPDVHLVLFDFRIVHLHERRPIELGQQIDLPSRLKQRTALLRSEEHTQLLSMAVDLSENLTESLFAGVRVEGRATQEMPFSQHPQRRLVEQRRYLEQLPARCP